MPFIGDKWFREPPPAPPEMALYRSRGSRPRVSGAGAPITASELELAQRMLEQRPDIAPGVNSQDERAVAAWWRENKASPAAARVREGWGVPEPVSDHRPRAADGRLLKA